jgi:hypothetical protein
MPAGRYAADGMIACGAGGKRLMADQAAVGCVGVVTVATRGSAGPGEVQLHVRGGTESFHAWSDESLPVGTPVLAVDSRDVRTVDVVPWNDLRLPPAPE